MTPNNLSLKVVAQLSISLMLGSCGGPQYIVKGSKEHSIQEHLIKTKHCSKEFKAIEAELIALESQSEARTNQLLEQAKNEHYAELEDSLSKKSAELEGQVDKALFDKVKVLTEIRDNEQLPMSKRREAHEELKTYRERLLKQQDILEQVQKTINAKAVVAIKKHTGGFEPTDEQLLTITETLEQERQLILKPLKQDYEQCAAGYLARENLVYIEQ